jgi:chromosome segregation ATPase
MQADRNVSQKSKHKKQSVPPSSWFFNLVGVARIFANFFLTETKKRARITISIMAQDGDEEVERKMAGSIVSMQLENFMNHSNFEIKFNSRVNFITGRNGSGKSAIIVALAVVLGSRAKSAGRGERMTDLIMFGKSFCFITITLDNTGLDPYMPSKFGKVVKITRKILRDKSSANYRIYGENDEELGKSFKHDVLPVLQHFNIQVENPCVVLTQDHCRTFIQNATEKG